MELDCVADHPAWQAWKICIKLAINLEHIHPLAIAGILFCYHERIAMTTERDLTRSPGVVAWLATLSAPLVAMAVRSEPQTRSAQELPPSELPITAILVYDPIDDEYRACIARELRTLRRQGCPISWIEYDISRATEFFTDIANPFSTETYELFLFLLSPDFIDRDEWYASEIAQLIALHLQGIWIAPILLRTCRWEQTPFGQTSRPLPILPDARRPVKKWSDPDDAYKVIADGIEKAVEYLQNHRM